MNHWGVLKTTAMFDGVEKKDLEKILACIDAKIIDVQKGEFVLLAGDKISHMGIVISGELHIIRECFDGKRSLYGSVMPGDTYAEAMCCAGIDESPVSVVAKTDSSVLVLNYSHILRHCINTCSFHVKLVKNMLKIVAHKNLQLQVRMEFLSMKSVRDKVLRYLESLVSIQGPNITIPFNREELANYLCVERSALSHELARMRDDNLIEYKKNRFYLKSHI